MPEMRSLNQFLKNRNGRWHYHRRVPSIYEDVDQRGMIRTSLRTRSLEVARARRDALAEADDLFWASLNVASNDNATVAVTRYQSAKKRAMARGFVYTPIDELASSAEVTDILTRLKVLDKAETVSEPDAEALLGCAKPTAHLVSDAFDLYCSNIAVSDLVGKSEAQKRSWRKVKQRAVNNFIALFGDIPMDQITRKHGQELHKWWGDRLKPKDGKKGLNPNSANRDIGNMRSLFEAYWKYEGSENRENPFNSLRFKGVTYKDVPPFDADWMKTKILRPGVFDDINIDAKLIVYAMIETGCRPSEIANLRSENIVLDHDVPHLRIRQRDDRKLKSNSSIRDIPLLGVSLEALKHAPNGFERYRDKGDNLSALLVKAFRTRGLFPTPDHRIYSIRHTFEKRMLEAGLDYGLRCTLMGHHNNRPEYGDGGSLEFRRKELSKIVYDVPNQMKFMT
jgi:integrase